MWFKYDTQYVQTSALKYILCVLSEFCRECESTLTNKYFLFQLSYCNEFCKSCINYSINVRYPSPAHKTLIIMLMPIMMCFKKKKKKLVLFLLCVTFISTIIYLRIIKFQLNCMNYINIFLILQEVKCPHLHIKVLLYHSN